MGFEASRLDRPYDITILGATGFTGGFLAQYIFREAFLGNWEKLIGGQPLRWALAGRSQSRLNAVLDDLSRVECEQRNSFGGGSDSEQGTKRPIPPVSRRRSSFSFKFLPTILLVDVTEEESLAAVCRSTNVLINCVGPFRHHGERVLKAAIQNKTHYVDISGETDWIERMMMKFDDMAREQGVVSILSCGFDSAAADFGVLKLKEAFANNMAIPYEITMYTEIQGLKRFNYTTYESAVGSLSNMDQLRRVRHLLHPKFVRRGPYVPHACENGRRSTTEMGKVARAKAIGNKWTVWFPSPDAAIVRLGQYITETSYAKQLPNYDTLSKVEYDERVAGRAEDIVRKTKAQRPAYFPVKFNARLVMPNLFATICMTLGGLVFKLLATTVLGRKLLLNNPKLFTFGLVTSDRPDRLDVLDTTYTQTFVGRGYTVPTAETRPEPIEMSLQWKGPDPGYTTCALLAVLSSVTLLDHQKTIDPGIHTPASALRKTPVVDRLLQTGMFSLQTDVTRPSAKGSLAKKEE